MRFCYSHSSILTSAYETYTDKGENYFNISMTVNIMIQTLFHIILVLTEPNQSISFMLTSDLLVKILANLYD